MADRNQPFVTLCSRQPADGTSLSSGDSAYGSSAGDERPPPATHDISRVNYHVKHLPDFAKSLEDSAARAFPNRGSSQRYKKVHAILLHWRSDDLFVLPELEDLDTCFREDFNFDTETFSIPSDNAHLELMLRVATMIKEHESPDTLFIVYYGGHAKIDESRQSTWCATRSSDSPWLQWSAIQTLLERSLSDVLILLDCCAGAASATFPQGNSITETISASSWDAIAPDPGRYSFTNALIEVLQEWNRRSFSAAMLHAEVLARLKHPRPIMLNGKHFEARSTPVHFMMTANHKAPSIEMTRIIPADQIPPSPPQEPMEMHEAHDNFGESSALAGRSAGPQEIMNTEPNEDVPHVMISLALEEDQRLNINEWETWLQSIPAIAKYVKVQGVFKSHSTLLLMSMPVMVWDLLPDNHACNFIAFVRSNNLAIKDHGTSTPIENEVPIIPEVDESRFSIFSGTTAYTFNDADTLGGDRQSMFRSPIDPSRRFSQKSFAPSTRSRARSGASFATPSSLHDIASRGTTTGHSMIVPHRQNTAPPSMLSRSISHDNISRVPIMNQQRNSRRTFLESGEDIPNRPELAPHIQARLESYFCDNPAPTTAVKEFLASNLGVETTDVDIWFFHRREQQKVSERLQNLRIDDSSRASSSQNVHMLLPGHMNRLLEIVPPSSVLVVDLRSAAEYERSHIHGALHFRAPASVVSRASLEMLEATLPDDDARETFHKWISSKCIVFYDKHVEFSWEAPTAEAMYQKLRGRGWNGQCFVLKGHFREFSASFDKYIAGTKMTDNARRHLESLEERALEKRKEDWRQYDEWLKQLQTEGRHHQTELVPAVKAERMEAMVQHQKQLEIEFEQFEPAISKQARDKPEGDWNFKANLVPSLDRGLSKMQEARPGSGRSTPMSDSKRSVKGRSAGSEYDLVEEDEDDPVYQKALAASRAHIEEERKAGRPSGGRGLFSRIIRNRPDQGR